MVFATLSAEFIDGLHVRACKAGKILIISDSRISTASSTGTKVLVVLNPVKNHNSSNPKYIRFP